MKLTDEKVAKALGYFVTTKGGVPAICKRTADNKWDRGSSLRLPAFTTSLDAIVAEIEVRGLAWRVYGSRPNAANVRQYGAWIPFDDGSGNHANGDDATDAAALCQALLAYLKEKP